MNDQVTSIILFDGFPLVLIDHNRFMTGHNLLDWYSEKYDICKARTIGLKSPTSTCSIKYVVCKCGTKNSVKEEDE